LPVWVSLAWGFSVAERRGVGLIARIHRELIVHPEFCFPWHPPFMGLKRRISDPCMYVNKKYIPKKIFSGHFLIKNSNGFAESEGGQGISLGRFIRVSG
jgi:hypothetical protein